MLSEEQKRQINLNILKVTSEFLATGHSIEEVAKATDLSSSSVQRYLNDKDRIIELLGEEVYEEIQALLKELKENAIRKGGINSTSKNTPIRDSSGKFVGNQRR